jgi:hypothetical protein
MFWRDFFMLREKNRAKTVCFFFGLQKSKPLRGNLTPMGLDNHVSVSNLFFIDVSIDSYLVFN